MRSLLAISVVVSWATAEACSYPEQFACSNGECVAKNLRCNFNKDCSDGSDELRCSQMSNDCMPPMWWTCDDGECISSLFRCDDMLHCMDHSDEDYCGEHHKNYTKTVECKPEEFHCDDICITKDWVCNSEPDCVDKTDELHCSSVQNSTLPYCRGFACADGLCIYDHWQCDGKPDCIDGSDEKNCTAKPVDADCDLNDGYFPCKDKKSCIPAEYLCDGLFKCDDHSDEGEACTDPKKNCASSNCTHGCINTPNGAFCVCPSGYGRVSNHSCEDLDECHLLHSHCSQHCHNVPGSFYCTCDEGYAIQNDNRSCKVLGREPELIFASSNHIMGYSLETMKYFPIIQTPTRPVGVAYDSKYVYWTSIERGYESINKAYHNASGLKELVKSGLKQPEGIAIDWYTDNIYFTESEISHIGVCTNDGQHCTVLISKNVQKPRGIVLNPNKGEMYWTDWGERPEIAKANMDGTNDKAIVLNKIHWPNGLTIDYPNERLYWVDGKHQSIESVRLDGSFRKSILGNIKHPYSIAVFGDKIYWTDWGTNSLESCNKFTGKDRKIMLKVDKVNGLHIYHPVMAPKKNHSCLNHSCQHICLLKGVNEHSCACPEGHILKDDKKRCIKIVDEKYMLLATGDMIMVLHHKLLGGHGFDFVRFPNLRIDGLLYDSYRDQVIIYDDREKMIYGIEACLTKTPKVSALITSEIGTVQGMDLDHVSRNLYWCDIEHGTVEVFSLETRSKATLMHRFIDGLYMDVAVVPSIGMMFLALIKKGQVIVTKIGMDGKGTPVHVIEHGLIGPVQLHYDSLSSRIFISDEGGRKIESIDIHGAQRQGFHEVNVDVVSITSLDNEIFWTGKTSKLLYWKENSNDALFSKHYKLDIPFHVYKTYATGVQIWPKMDHVCSPPNHACSHICVLSNSDGQSSDKKDRIKGTFHSCLCPEDMVLGPDKKTCEKSIVCDSDYFKCEKSNVCIKRARLCDHVSDCTYGEDEVGCSELKSECEENQFQCRNGRCIEYSDRCNKQNDCSDNSDEENCEHYDHDLRCTKTEFICKSGMCLEQTLRCDNQTDCPDGDDEENCSKHKCPENFFHCLTGNCIPATWECDRRVDCEDGSDEHNKCLYNKPCDSGMFKCRTGNCIDAKLYCDKVEDCDDGSDEFNCPTSEQEIKQEKECQDTEYACETNTTICLPYNARCNGTAECPDGEDEYSCSLVKCLPSEWKCTGSDICIQKQFRCDHSKDCSDGSDEDPEMCNNLKNNHTELIKHLMIVSAPCKNGFLCGSGQCIDYGSMCDGFANCYDGSDENGLCNTACSKKLCSDTCIPSPRGAICTCNGSRVLGPDGFKCSPPPPACLQNPCQHRCKDNKDSYICSCFEGYGLTSDRKTCKALGEPKSFVFMNSAQLRKLNTKDNSISVLHKDDALPLTGMDVFTAKNSIFFTIEKQGEIRHLNFQTKKETIVSGLGKPGLIAVDWVSENVYFVNNEAEKTIMVCHMDKQKCAKLRDLETKSLVTALIVDPVNKLMFYSLTSWLLDGHPKSTIYMTHLDGTHVVEMVSKDLGQCSGLAVDYERKLLYFSDQQLNKIESINYEMSHRNVVLQNSSYAIRPRGLDVFEDEIYFLALGTPKVIICKLHGDKKCSPRNLRMFGVESFKIDQQSKQKKVVDHCSTTNCSHICVQGEFTGQCLCNDGKSVGEHEICANSQTGLKFEDGRLFSTHIETPTVNNASGKAISAIIIIIAIVVLVLGAIFLYRHQKKKLGKASKLDYSVHFQNPGFGGAFSNFSIGLGNLASRFPVLSRPTQNEFSNPIETKIVPNDWPPSALDPKLLQLKQKIQGSQLEVPNLLGDSDSDVESDRDFHDGEHKERARLIK